MPTSFKISSQHLEAFSRQQKDRFTAEMVQHLREAYPEKAARLDESKLREFVDEGIALARKYDILIEGDVARYIDLMMAISPDFDENRKTPWAKEILSNRRLGAGQKLDQIEQQWAAVQATGGKI